MEYVNYIKAKTHQAISKKSETPVLSEEDEQFLNKITSDENPPPLPPRQDELTLALIKETTGRDAQTALMDGAQNIALPETPQEITEEPSLTTGLNSATTEAGQTKSKTTWSWLRRDSRDAKREATASGLDDIAQGLKQSDDGELEKEVEKEEEDMTIVLDRLNLAAVNNRVFSISDETQELLQKFNQIVKDLINGVPTAYDDLEKLLTNGDRQLQKTFNALPSFLQKLIEKLPETMTKGLAPEIMAAAAERAQKSGFNMAKAGKAASAASMLGMKPSLKDLVGKPSAITGLLRSIITFLRARFPAFMGMNVLWSLAMFVLLFVFWYCHKRGKEVRLEKERELTEQEVKELDQEYRSMNPDDNDDYSSPPLTTTAASGASMEDVRAGMKEVDAIRRSAMEDIQ